MNDWVFRFRVMLCVAAFLLLLSEELLRRPGEYRRGREYLFLGGVTVAAALYGVVHDFVTWSICPGYFVAGKGIPQASSGFTKDVVVLAMKATWYAGLLTGAVLLIANNRDRLSCQLGYGTLVKMALIPLGISMLMEGIVGIAFGCFAKEVADGSGFDVCYERFGARFFVVWGMHLGAYLGGAIGLAIAFFVTVSKKRNLSGAK